MHVPVLLKEVLQVLRPEPGEFVIDGTLGAGGHAKAFIEQIKPGGIFLGVDWDKEAIERVRGTLQDADLKKLVLRQVNYRDLPKILTEENLGKADALLVDLGFSTDQLTGRGFSFQKDEPLLMTYSDDELPVRSVIRQLKERELATVIREYSDEKYAMRIAEAIRRELKKTSIDTTGRLAEVIRGAVPKNYENGCISAAI